MKANIVRRPVGKNDAGIPEDEIRDIFIPIELPVGTVFTDPTHDEHLGPIFKRYDHKGRRLP